MTWSTRTAKPRPVAPVWKPTACTCGTAHPTRSRKGAAGPWLCRNCDRAAA